MMININNIYKRNKIYNKYNKYKIKINNKIIKLLMKIMIINMHRCYKSKKIENFKKYKIQQMKNLNIIIDMNNTIHN